MKDRSYGSSLYDGSPMRTCDSWRAIKRCCHCARHLSKAEWKRAGKPGQGYTDPALGYRVWHPMHLRCGQAVAQHLVAVAEALEHIREVSRWN